MIYYFISCLLNNKLRPQFSLKYCAWHSQVKILYLYLNPVDETYRKIQAGELPSNYLYGLVELQNLGYDVSYRDSRPRGMFRSLIYYLNNKLGIHLKDVNTLKSLMDYDVIVVKGPFSTLTTIVCRLFGKNIIYLDPILKLPRNNLRKFFFAINLKYSDGSIIFSRSQFDLILKTFKINDKRLKLIPFCLDSNFFKPVRSPGKYTRPYILSVGMDIGRDYDTLLKAVKDLEVDLKIVTLPYLIEGLPVNEHKIEILSKIPYNQLFELYAESLFVVIPLKKWAAQYSSGTTSLLEAKLLGKAVISTYSRPLEEYLEHENGVYYVDAENVPSLRQAIISFLRDPEFCYSLQNKGADVVANNYNTYVFANIFGSYLSSLFTKGQNK